MCLDHLRSADRAEAELAPERAAYRKLTGEAVRVGAKVAARDRSGDIQCGDRDDRGVAPGQQDSAVGRKPSEPRAAIGAIVEARRSRIKRQPQIADPHLLIRAWQEQFDLGPLDPPVQNQLEQPIFRLPPAGLDVERPVAAADARSAEPQLGRIELEIGKSQEAIGGSLEIGRDSRQATGQAGEKSIVETPHP